MIPEIAGLITRYEGRKFLKLKPRIDENIIVGTGVDEGISLYIHIPFCRSLCPFCCFNRYLFNEDAARRYFRSLNRELDYYIERGFRFSDFYFGGGTPTILMDELESFIDYIRAKFDVRQISLETTPREINEQNIEILRKAGVNRLSIGVQSFDDDILNSIGRVFISGEETKKRLSMTAGKFDTLNIDLVFNLPSQSVNQFQSDVRIFKEMGIDQATFYPLMPSPHKKDAMERRFNRIDMSREKKFYEIIMSEIFGAGYEASTAWCFSRGDRMIDEYIIESDDYIGIGSGSVSVLKGNFFVNSFELDKYGSMITDGRLPVVGWRPLSRSEHLRYYLLTKLFGLSVDREKFRKRFDTDMKNSLYKELLALRISGTVRNQGDGKIVVTKKGMYPVSVMMREFFASLNTLREHHIENQI
ncbi:coproporphyrinogen III oxidase family protein [Chloroflexota bacterium]